MLGACSSDGDDKSSDDTTATSSTGDWELQISSTPAMLAELDTAIGNEEPIVVTLWRPHWAYAEWDLKDLDDPEGAMGSGEEIWLAANADYADANPDIIEALERFEMDDDLLASLEVFTQKEFEDDPEKGAEEWLADSDDNRNLADEWVGDLEGTDTVTIGLIDWDEAIAVTNLWKVLLEEAGFTVEIENVEAGPLFIAMAAGDIDVFFDTWLPITHEDYWEEHGDDIVKVNKWYDGETALTITVPAYMDIDSLDELASIGDEVDHKIVGIDAGAGLTRITLDEMIPTYLE